MTRQVFIGKASKHLGKTAFQILANLKNFGVGRMLTQYEFAKYPEPSFHIVRRVQTYMDPQLKFGTLWCETIIRGRRLPGIRPLTFTYRPDFRLIAKDEEEKFIGNFDIKPLGHDQNILPRNYQVPPLMNEWLKLQQFKQSEDKSNFRIPFLYQDEKDLSKQDADLFWIANRLVNEEDQSDKPNVNFDGKYKFNESYLKNCVQ